MAVVTLHLNETEARQLKRFLVRITSHPIHHEEFGDMTCQGCGETMGFDWEDTINEHPEQFEHYDDCPLPLLGNLLAQLP